MNSSFLYKRYMTNEPKSLLINSISKISHYTYKLHHSNKRRSQVPKKLHFPKSIQLPKPKTKAILLFEWIFSQKLHTSNLEVQTENFFSKWKEKCWFGSNKELGIHFMTNNKCNINHTRFVRKEKKEIKEENDYDLTKDKDPQRKEIVNRGKFFCWKIWSHLH